MKKIFFESLYLKIGTWLFLNFLLLLVIAASFIAFIMFSSSDGLLPAHWFNENVENKLRVVSSSLQYRPIEEWTKILSSFSGDGIRFHMVDMDQPYIYYSREFLPHSILETASRIPKTNFTLCPTSEDVFNSDFLFQESRIKDMEAGISPVPPALFMHAGNPSSWWYGRMVVMPDSGHNAHYVLLAIQSSTFTGNGLFFNVRFVIWTVLAGIILSCLWWMPLIWHIVSPLKSMASFAEGIASSGYDVQEGECTTCPVPAERRDEIGKLCRTLTAMTEKLSLQMTGQRQFIHHIAHEINTPLWRCRLGLSVLEERLEGDNRKRVQRCLGELDNLTSLTSDILAFLKAQSKQEVMKCSPINLSKLLSSVVADESEKGDVELRLNAESDVIIVLGNSECIRRAVHNLIRNAALYAGKAGPVIVEACVSKEAQTADLSVLDNGNGVKIEEINSLFEPFYRSPEAQLTHPGGSGLGLAIVKNSAEQCGAKVRCFNRVPHGFGVTITFALADKCGQDVIPSSFDKTKGIS